MLQRTRASATNPQQTDTLRLSAQRLTRPPARAPDLVPTVLHTSRSLYTEGGAHPAAHTTLARATGSPLPPPSPPL